MEYPYLTAYHEAGHVVAMYALKILWSSVTITPSAKHDYEGTVERRSYYMRDRISPSYPTEVRRSWVERRVIAIMAGHIAEVVFLVIHDVTDSGTAVNFALWEGGTSDVQQASDLLATVCESENEINVALQRLDARAQGLICNPRWWLAVEALAAELLARKTVRYYECRRIIARAIHQ